MNGQLTPVAPNRVTGKIAITGSSTVYPLTLRMAREFRMAGELVNDCPNLRAALPGTGVELAQRLHRGTHQ